MHGDDGQIWESFDGHCVAKPSMDSPNTGNDFSASVFSIDKTVRIFRSSLSFGKEMLSACCLSVRRPRWIHNPTRFLTLPAHCTWLSKDEGKASDSPTSHAVLEQVPSTGLGWIPTDFLNERRRRKLMGVWGHASPVHFWILTPSSSLSWRNRILFNFNWFNFYELCWQGSLFRSLSYWHQRSQPYIRL